MSFQGRSTIEASSRKFHFRHICRPTRRKLDWTRTKCVPYGDDPYNTITHTSSHRLISHSYRAAITTRRPRPGHCCWLANAPGRGVSPLYHCSKGDNWVSPKKKILWGSPTSRRLYNRCHCPLSITSNHRANPFSRQTVVTVAIEKPKKWRSSR